MMKKFNDDASRRIAEPYPPELIMMSMLMMANGTEASKVNSNIVTVLDGTGRLDEELYNWPDQRTYRRWRFGMAHVCQVHIGLALTKAAHNKQQVHFHSHALCQAQRDIMGCGTSGMCRA